MTTTGAWLGTVDKAHRFEAELLLVEHAGLTRAKLLAFPETPIDAQVLHSLQQDLQRVANGEPLAYILGYREFWGLAYRVSPDVLVPRPETELLVERVINTAQSGSTILDLGTGSGAIAIAIASERPDLTVTATDISPAALEIASLNAQDHAVDVRFALSDWFDEINHVYDTIVSNPPYIPTNDPHLTDLHYEPSLALVAEANGLAALEHIVSHATNYLTPGGNLLVEHGFDQASAVRALFAAQNFQQIEHHHDLAGHHRVTQAVSAVI